MTRFLLVALVLAGLAAPARATPTSLFVFGDSLADSGNNAVVFDAMGAGMTPPLPPCTLRTRPIPNAAFIPTFPYAGSDRYSNGPVWVEYLAQGLGIADGAKARC